MQLAIDGLIALVVVVSHLVILARMAYSSIVFTYRYIPYVIRSNCPLSGYAKVLLAN